MIKKNLYLGLMLFTLSAGAQNKSKKQPSQALTREMVIPLKADNWDFKESKVEFTEYKSRPAMKILVNSGPVVLKNMDFTDGTIEFDHEPLDPNFASMYFRWKEAAESECFYFRTAAAGNPLAIQGVQYAAYIRGINLWDLLPHYQGNATFQKKEWNHVKLIISGKQMRVYVNSDTKPTLEIPRLEGDVTHGTLAFEGEAIISNLIVKPNQTEGLSPFEGIDPTDNDPRLIRNWQVSQPVLIPKNIDFSYDLIPNKETVWDTLIAERRGLVNLTRKFGASPERRIVWLRKNISSATAQRKKFCLGFSDEVWVIINGKLLFVDKNWFTHPIRKEPGGRISLENSSFILPLQAGDNEILIGVANDFYGWGIIASVNLSEGAF